MSFVNTVVVVGDKALTNSIIDGSIKTITDDISTTIGAYAFYECKALTTADFPGVTQVDRSAFQRCSALTALVLRSATKATMANVNALDSTPIEDGKGYIYVPSALIDSYKADSKWSTFANQFRKLEDYTVDGTVTGEVDPTRCRVRFFNDDGTYLGYVMVPNGGNAVYPGDEPVKEGDFTFLGFAPSPTNVTVDMDCYAQYINIYTWDTVIAAVQDGSYKNLYSVGDIIPLDMGSEGTFNMVIAGIDVDDLADGSGKAAITWISKELFATKRVFSPKQTPDVVYGWSNSQLRNYLNTDIKTLIPEKVRSAIKGVTKIQPEWDTTEALVTKTSTDEVWIPSYDEMFGTSSLYKELFKDAEARRIKYTIGTNTASFYWLRTQYDGPGITIVKSDGSRYLNNYYAQTKAYPLCFCT